jgi:hypothetical protein
LRASHELREKFEILFDRVNIRFENKKKKHLLLETSHGPELLSFDTELEDKKLSIIFPITLHSCTGCRTCFRYRESSTQGKIQINKKEGL